MFGDLGKIMKLAGQMKEKVPEMKEKLANAEYTAEAGNGKVTVTVNGRLQLTDLKLDEELFGEAVDVAMIEDLIKAAISAAQAQAVQDAQAAMEELTGGMDIPGLM